MKVFSITPQYDSYKSFVPKNMDSNISIRCKGKPLDWPKPLEVISDDEDIGMPEADFSLLNIGSIVFSETVYKRIGSIAKEFGQLLPMIYGDRNLYLWNVTNINDCLDKDKSQMNAFGGVSKPVFDSQSIPDLSVFKIKEDNYTGIFCTGKFLEIINEEAFSGLETYEFDVV